VSDPPTTIVKEPKPKLLSWAWWRHLGGALNYTTYTPREWGINILSTQMTLLQVGVGVKAWGWITLKLPWLVPTAKAVATAVVAFFVALGKLAVSSV
jgi:hypothetical protein